MCVHFNLMLVNAEAPFQVSTITSLLGSVSYLHMEDVVGMEIDLVIPVAVKKPVDHQVSIVMC